MEEAPKYPPPPPPAPKRLSRPKITLQIPQTPLGGPPSATSRYSIPKYHGYPPRTPEAYKFHPNFNPEWYAHMTQASDFIRNTAKSGLSFGEKTAFWIVSKLKHLSKKWLTHFFLMVCLVLYSVMGAAIFMALEGPHEEKYDKKLGDIRREFAKTVHDFVIKNTALKDDNFTFIVDKLELYEKDVNECITKLPDNNTTRTTWTFVNSMFYSGTIFTTIGKLPTISLQLYPPSRKEFTKLPDNNTTRTTWTFVNSMFYPGTIFTTIGKLRTMSFQLYPPLRHARASQKYQITTLLEPLDLCQLHVLLRHYIHYYRSTSEDTRVVMSEEGNEHKSRLTLQIPTITQDSQCQTSGKLVSRSKSSERANVDEMETQNMSIKKRRNLSKNRGSTARQREKTPEPGRTPIPHEDTPTSEDEDNHPRNSREIEADNTYEEMKRLVQEQSAVKDPVYDLDTDAVIEARAMAANERRRRSVSPFAVMDKEIEGQPIGLQRKGSFIDPTNKLLSTTYTLSPKDEDTGRRGSLTFEPPPERKRSLTPSTPTTASPKDTNFPYPFPSTPKKLEEIIYPDEQAAKSEEKEKLPKTPVKKEVFTFDQKDGVQEKKPVTKPKTPETPATPGELVTKVYQIERTPSRKVLPENKPAVEIRERVVRTPSRKLTGEGRPNIVKQVLKPKDELPQTQSKVPPVKPARSKSATRFGGKTSESEMSEDQTNQHNLAAQASRRKVVPTPRRFVRNRSPRANRSQSVNRVEDVKVIDKSGSGMSQTSREIIELMQQARARSLSITKDDPRLPPEYRRDYNKNLQTPNKTPSTPRRTRGISCPKTIQIISDKEILSGLTPANKASVKTEKHSRQSSGYIDASQSEYTSSCYSSSPSENEYDFDLSERTAELTRKLKLLSQEVDKRENRDSVILAHHNNTHHVEHKSGLRKRSTAEAKNGVKKEKKEDKDKDKQTKEKTNEEKKKPVKSKWKFIANWQQFKEEHKSAYKSMIRLRNQCICDFILLITLCGLGGMMFRTFEGSFENNYKCSTRNVKRDFIENLWRGSHYLREEDWKSMARSKLYEFENQLHTAHEAGVTSFSGQRSWNFMNSFVYCLTLITTIGYGHITPKTLSGRIATIVYAIVGIPLFLIVLADFGKLFTRIIKFLWSFIRRFYYTRSCRRVRRVTHVEDMVKGLNMVADVVRRPSQIFNTEEDTEDKADGNGDPPKIERKASDVPPPLPPKPGQLHTTIIDDSIEPETPAPSDFVIDEEFNLPISIAIFILVLYIVVGALGYDIWEKWGFFESFYFVFISMTTIGLGDYVPKHPLFMMMSILYLVFGLALMSMCINVVQVKLSDTFKRASRKIADTVGLPMAEEESLAEGNPVPPIEIASVHKGKSKTEEDKDTNNEGKESETKEKFVQINCD